MLRYKNKVKDEVQLTDSWMKENFIPVHPSTSIKMLKPYQRMVILRKPEGEKKCIIDISLLYEEIENLKNQISENYYPNVFDQKLFRIIPPISEVERRFKNISKTDMDAVAKMLADPSFNGGDIELDEMSVVNLESKNTTTTIKLQDDKINISLNEVDKKQSNIPIDKDIDNIDEVDIKIPLEEVYNQKWNDFDGYLNNLDSALKEKDSNKAIDLISAMIEPSNQQTISENELVNNVEVDNNQINQSYETDYLDDASTVTNVSDNSEKPSLSFFKNDSINYSNLNSTARVSKRINFYKEDPNAEYEKVVLNRKKKMFMYRRKLDKSLLK